MGATLGWEKTHTHTRRENCPASNWYWCAEKQFVSIVYMHGICVSLIYLLYWTVHLCWEKSCWESLSVCEGGSEPEREGEGERTGEISGVGAVYEEEMTPPPPACFPCVSPCHTSAWRRYQSVWLIHPVRKEEDVLIALPDPQVILSLSCRGGRVRRENRRSGWGCVSVFGGGDFSHISSSHNFTVQKCEHCERERQVAIFHHVCPHSHPAEDRHQHSFQTGKRPFLACKARCGGMSVFMGESPAPDRKGCWLLLGAAGQAWRERRVPVPFLGILMDKCFLFNFPYTCWLLMNG